MMRKLIGVGIVLIFILGIGYVYAGYVAKENYNAVSRAAQESAQKYQEFQAKRHPAGQTTYRNDTFGFAVALPQSWQGYTINHIKEDMYDITGKTKTNNGVVDSFQIIEIHHPLENPQNPRQAIPVMVFTLNQWTHVQKEEWSVGAAPIPPSELGRNSTYVMALPARYNYAYKTGWEEVQQILDRKPLTTFELGN